VSNVVTFEPVREGDAVEIVVAVKLRVRLSGVPAATAARMTKQDVADTVVAALPLGGLAELVVAAAHPAELIGEAAVEVSPWFDPIPADDDMDLADYSPSEWPLLPPCG